MIPHTHVLSVQQALLPKLLLVLALLLTGLLYRQGLHGPFLLDDAVNLSVIQDWLAHKSSLGDVVFNTTASPYGRPLSMASLALSAWLGGYTPFAFKLGNLIVHLLCGSVLYLLIRRVALCAPGLQPRASWVAALVTAMWLLHPLQASTVLYAVQRMAQTSVLFMFLGLWLFVAMRVRLEQGPSRAALAGLFLGLPLLTVAGFLSKENALLLPALCLVLELGCFAGPPARPRAVNAFFGLYLALPLLAGSVVFALNPARLLGGYVSRDFDWQERLLTQARALCDYLWRIVVPNPPRMGVYTDDFAISTGLMSPPSTLVSILVLLALTGAAWKLRRKVPALFVGWGLFMVGHAMESSLLPLELYFEHRNYLPMAGVLYALVGLVFAAGDVLRASGMQVHRIGGVLSIGILALLAFGTHGRARTWGDEALLVESAVAAHPDSMRAQLAVVDAAVRRNDLPRAAIALDAMTNSDNAKVRAQGHLNRINLACASQHSADARDLELAVHDAPARIGKDESETFSLLLSNTSMPCAGISDGLLADAAATFADRALSQPDWFRPKAELRHTAASFHARHGDWAKAKPLAQLAWQPGMPAAASLVLINAQLATYDLEGAERTYNEALVRIDPAQPQDAAGMRWLRAQIDATRQQESSEAAPGEDAQ